MEGFRGRPIRGTVYRQVWWTQEKKKAKINNKRKGKASAKK